MRRGDRNADAHIQGRRQKVMELMSEGKDQPDIVEELGISRMTLWRDLQSLEKKYGVENSEQLKAIKAKMFETLIKAAEAVWVGEIEPEVANAYRGILAEVSKLLGLNAPQKTISAHVDLNEQQSRYARIMRACRGILAEERWNQIIAYLEQLPRDDNPFPTVGRIIDQKVIENE
jgi:DNA-binding CsgD family transcriptional regulator